MSRSSVALADDRLHKEYSFLKPLSLSPRESLAPIHHENLGISQLFNTSIISEPSAPEIHPSLRTAVSKPQIVSGYLKETPAQVAPKAVIVTKSLTVANPTRLTRSASSAPKPQVRPRLSASNMALLSQAQDHCLKLCQKGIVRGNHIAVHILEYLTTVKTPADGFEYLAHEFLDTIEILVSVEAGLEKNSQKIPSDMISELNTKFQVALADFQALDLVVNKLLEKELGTSSRLKRGWGKMFGDNDLSKHRSALSRIRESLRMSALAFQWSFGSEKIRKEMGIGYTGLAAALDRLDKFEREIDLPTKILENNIRSLTSTAMDLSTQTAYQQQIRQQQSDPRLHQHPQPLLPLPWPEKASSNELDSSIRGPLSPVRDQMIPQTDYRQESRLSNPQVTSGGTNEHIHPWASERHSSFDHGMAAIDDAQSHTGTAESDSLLHEVGGVEIDFSKVVRLKAEPSTMPRWASRNAGGPNTGNMRPALISAIRSRNHKLLEQMLDQGVPANTGPDMNALKEAVLAYDAESVRILLLFGADPNHPDRNGVTPLFAAVEKSFLAGATTLLKYGADPNYTPNTEIESPLGAAVMANKVGFTHLLLIFNGDVNYMTSNGNTLLISAIKKKTPKKFIDLVLNYGANPNAKSREGKTALFEAIQLGRADLVQSLLDHGADPNLPGPKHMLWPSTYQAPCLKLLLDAGADTKKCPGIMELATSLNNIESVRILLKAGVNPNDKKDGVYTPLCTSIRDDRSDIFQLLLSNKADPNTPASEYPAFKCITHNRMHFLPRLVAAGAHLHSPKGILETAVKSNNMEALNWLLDQGVNPNEKNPKGHTPLTTAIAEDHIKIVDLLLHRGADPNVRGQDWPVCLAVKNPPILSHILSVLPEPRAFKGVLEMAVSANQLESVKLLIAAGVSVEDKNGGVFSPLTTALRENHRQIVRYLLEEGGADVNSPGEHLPIVKALRRFHGEDTEMLELLLDHGADPNLAYRGWNGMMQAVENGDEDVLRLIVKRSKVDLEVKDELGRNIIKIAESRGWNEAVRILRGKSS